MGEVTIFVGGAGEAPTRHRPNNAVYDGTSRTHPYAVVCEAFPRQPAWSPTLPPATHRLCGWADPRLSPPLSRTRGAHHGGQILWQERPGTPCSSLSSRPAGTRSGSRGSPPPTSTGQRPSPAPPSRRPRRGEGCTPSCEPRRSPPLRGSTLCDCPGTTRQPPWAQGPEPDPRPGAVARRVGRVLARLPLHSRWMATDPWPPETITTTSHPPLPPLTAPHGTGHGTPLMNWEVVGQAHLRLRMPNRITAMSDSAGPLQRDDRNHRRSRSRSPVSPGYAGETPAEREERQLADAAIPVRPPAERPQAAPNDPKPPSQEPVPAREAALPPRLLRLPPRPQGGAQMGKKLRLPPRPAAPRPPARRRRGGQAPRGPGAPRQGTPWSRRRAERAPSTAPIPSAATAIPVPQKPYLPKAAFPEQRPRPVRPPMPKRTPPGITLPQLQRQRDARRVVQEGGDGDQAGRVGTRWRRTSARGGRRRELQRQGTDAKDGPERRQPGERERARAGREGQQQQRWAGIRAGPGRRQGTEGHGAQPRTRARAREGRGRQRKRQGRE